MPGNNYEIQALKVTKRTTNWENHCYDYDYDYDYDYEYGYDYYCYHYHHVIMKNYTVQGCHCSHAVSSSMFATRTTKRQAGSSQCSADLQLNLAGLTLLLQLHQTVLLV